MIFHKYSKKFHKYSKIFNDNSPETEYSLRKIKKLYIDKITFDNEVIFKNKIIKKIEKYALNFSLVFPKSSLKSRELL